MGVSYTGERMIGNLPFCHCLMGRKVKKIKYPGKRKRKEQPNTHTHTKMKFSYSLFPFIAFAKS